MQRLAKFTKILYMGLRATLNFPSGIGVRELLASVSD